MKLLILGPMAYKEDAVKTGGIIVLYENLLSWLDEQNINFTSITQIKKTLSNRNV